MYKASRESILWSSNTQKCFAMTLTNKRKTQTHPCLQVESPVGNTPGAEYGLEHEIRASTPTRESMPSCGHCWGLCHLHRAGKHTGCGWQQSSSALTATATAPLGSQLWVFPTQWAKISASLNGSWRSCLSVCLPITFGNTSFIATEHYLSDTRLRSRARNPKSLVKNLKNEIFKVCTPKNVLCLITQKSDLSWTNDTVKISSRLDASNPV